MTSDILEKELKEEKLNFMYVLYGEEIYLLETVLKKIKKLFGECVPGINYIELDEESVIKSLMSEIKTPPFGYNKKLIVIKNSGLFKKETKKKINGLKELRDELSNYLEENIDDIKQSLIIAFVEDSVEKLNITKKVERTWTEFYVDLNIKNQFK